MRIAWFSPVPPDRSGIAAYTAEITPLLAPHLDALDLFTADRHDFVWRHRRHPYDLIVYHLGNSAAHDFIWAYLFRYPGLLVLHDAQIHQARALWLLKRLEPRLDDYLAELDAAHPEAPAGVGYLFAAGLGGDLFRLWPMTALAIRASRATVVHNAHLAERLARAYPGTTIRHLDMGVGDSIGERGTVPRRRHGIPHEAVVLGAFGGITPEKRIAPLLEAVAASPRTDLHALLVGPRADHYDVDADVARLNLADRVHIAGYVPDAELADYLAAVDICWCLRWPSNGETSASWLRCLSAGKPTLITALAQLRDVPALTVNERRNGTASTSTDAVAIAVDPADEAREIPVAIDTLAADASLRQALGANARARWLQLHSLPRMADGYLRAIEAACTQPAPEPILPRHLRDDGSGTARRLLASMHLAELPW